MLTEWMEKEDIEHAQWLVTERHYLHSMVDTRCSVQGYDIFVNALPAGVLLFGRPEATKCYPWYGSVEDVEQGRAEVTRWQIINLARVYLDYEFQPGGMFFNETPGYTDRRGVRRSTLLSEAINEALDRLVIDYLLARPPCFLDEPYELRYCLSYCDTNRHKGALYKAAGFEFYRTNERGLQTWRKALRPLTAAEQGQVEAASRSSHRSQKYRGKRLAERSQLSFSF